MRTTKLLGGLIVLLALQASGCFFSPRKPESGGGEVCYQSVAPKTLEALFVNLNGSMTCLQQTTYEDQLGQTFLFTPTPSAVAGFPGAFADEWDREQESLFLSQLFSTSDSLIVDLRVQDVQDPDGDIVNGPVTVTAEYTLARVESGGGRTVYKGIAEYILDVVATSWVMLEWDDRELESGVPTLSDLRGGLAQGGS